MKRQIVALLTLCILPLTPLSGQSAKDVIDTHNSAYAARDYDAFLGTFAEDAVVVLDGTAIIGRDAIGESYWANFSEDAPQVRITRQGRLAGGGVAQAEAYVLANGEEICCSQTVFRVRGGQIVRVDINTSAMGLGG